MTRRGHGHRHRRPSRAAVRRFAVADDPTSLGEGDAGRPSGWSGPARPEVETPVADIRRREVDGSEGIDPSEGGRAPIPDPEARGRGSTDSPIEKSEPPTVADHPGRRATDRAGAESGSQGRAERTACSPSQLRRFIKSRPYVPLHELRRRFAIDGAEDDVVQIEVDGRGLFVGLPRPEAEMLRDLLRSGEVGVELLVDLETPVVVGVYPMRPVPRS